MLNDASLLTPDAYCDALERDAAAFIDIVRSADPQSPVPACAGWRLVDLGCHLGSVHRWARAAIVTGVAGEPPTPPDRHEDLAAWLTEGAAALLTTLRTTDPDAPAWTFGPPPRQVSFWARRQAHETAVHLVDAQQAAGRPARMDAALAADAVAEVVTMFFPRQVRLERIPPLVHGLRLVLADAAGTSFVLAGDGTDPGAPTSATVTGSAADLALVLWGRVELDALEIEGDRDVALAVLTTGITP
jgi:uncharacterized protein (TIGR03083 family)